MASDPAPCDNGAVMAPTASAGSVLSEEHSRLLRELGDRYGVTDLRVFGSRSRGEGGPESDLDLLVRIRYGRGVAKRFLHFCRDAESLLTMKVDVVTEDGLDPRLHERIFREARPL